MNRPGHMKICAAALTLVALYTAGCASGDAAATRSASLSPTVSEVLEAGMAQEQVASSDSAPAVKTPEPWEEMDITKRYEDDSIR